MAMGYGANFAIVLQEDKLNDFNLREHKSFLEKLEEKNVDIGDFAESISRDDIFVNRSGEYLSEDESDELFESYEVFIKAFMERTNLSIALEYHSSDDGDCYDDVDGHYYTLDFGEVYGLSDDAIELSKKIPFNFAYFVHFG